jgi:hypothetical protein
MICCTRAASSVPSAKYSATRDTQKAAHSALIDTHGDRAVSSRDEFTTRAGVAA